jgi:LPS-assembly protein
LFSCAGRMRKLAIVSNLMLATAPGAIPLQSQESFRSEPAAQPFDSQAPLPEEDTITIENLSDHSEVEYHSEEDLWYGRYGILVRYRDVEVIADQAVLSEETGDVIANGNVRLRSAAQYWTGEHLEYNFRTGKIKSTEFRAGYPPFFIKGLALDASSDEQTYVAAPATVTSDDVKEPTFKIRAKKLQVRLGKAIHATGATLYLGNVPAMWLPVYTRSLERHRAYWRLTPGYRSRYGPFLRSEYHFPLYGSLSGVATIDTFQKRGIGFGPGLEWDSPKWGRGNGSYWQIKDNEPGQDFQRNPLPSNRERINFSHLVHLQTNVTVRGVISQQSDPMLLRDFFEGEYRENSQPKSFIEGSKYWDNWSLDIMAQPQLNEFLQTVERLPDIRLSGIRQQIGETPLFYESETSAGYFRFNQGIPRGTNYAAIRGDSFHQILWPQTYFGWLNVAPRVGGRVTHYGETEGHGSTFDERERFVFNTGMETSLKASRVWRGARNEFFDVNELRHIVEPSLNYVFVPDPTLDPNQLPQFDREIPSLRLLPIDYPDYNAIDSVDSQNVLRLGLRNKLQTKRGTEPQHVQNVVNWGIMGDWRLDPRQGQSTFSDVFSDIDVRPRSWMHLGSQTQYRVESGQWQGVYHTLTITPGEVWSWRVGHRYFRGGPEFGPESDNNTVFHTFYYKFNENWAGRISHHFEARDGTLEEQYYTLYRDFRSWTGALTFRVREDRWLDETEFAVAFTFQFKAFPRFGVGSDANVPEFLLGG